MLSLEMAHIRPIMVSLWAAPGVGKSSVMAGLFNHLKFKGFNAEMSTEFAQDAHYEGQWAAMKDQFWITANQEHRNFRLVGQADIIITDSPPGLGLLYSHELGKDLLRDMVYHCRQRYQNFDVRLLRDTGRPYRMHGRTQTEAESTALDEVLDGELRRIAPNAMRTRADALCASDIAVEVIRRIERGTV